MTMASEGSKRLVMEAQSFICSLSNVFLLKKRDEETKHLLTRARILIERLIIENQNLSSVASTLQHLRRHGHIGQYWEQLMVLKRKCEDLNRIKGRSLSAIDLSNGRHKYEDDNEVLRQQIAQMQKSIRELQSKQNTLTDQCKQAIAALTTSQSRNNALEDQYKQAKEALNTVQRSTNTVQERTRLDEESSLRRADNQKTLGMNECISEHCRPSNIALNYNTLESQQWVDAKEELEAVLGSQMDEKQITGLLCQAFMNIYDAARHVYVNLEHVIGELLAHPTFAMELVESRVLKSNNLNVLTTEMADLVKQKLRQTVNTLEKDVICKRSRLKDPNLEDLVNTSSSRQVVNCFLQECASISWQMIIQSPPMLLAVDDTKFDDAKHKLWWSCDRSLTENVDSFVWPVLFDYEGGHVLVKGCVYAN